MSTLKQKFNILYLCGYKDRGLIEMLFGPLRPHSFCFILLVSIAFAAYFQGKGVASLISSALAVDEKTLALVDKEETKKAIWVPLSSHSTSVEAVLLRNPLDSVRGDLTRKEVAVIDAQHQRQIKKINAYEYNVKRALLTQIFSKPLRNLFPWAHVVPEKIPGEYEKTVALRLYGIRFDTFFGKLGLKNGDRIEQVNGINVAILEHSPEIFVSLDTVDQFTLSINRGGQTITIVFHIK